MNYKVIKWLHICVVSLFFTAAISDLAAKESDLLPKGMTPQKLVKSVNRKYAYINKRLMSESALKKIKLSGNKEAISLIKEAQLIRDNAGKLIEKKAYKKAYFELKELNAKMSKALKLSRSGARQEKKLKDAMHSAEIINDTYVERAKKRDISVNSSSEAFAIYKDAIKMRVKASKERKAKRYLAAIESYKNSTNLLKKAIRNAKKPE